MEILLNKEPVKRVQELISKFDSKLKVIVLNTTARTAKDAATSLKCEVGAIVKSLLFKADDIFLICLTPPEILSAQQSCARKRISLEDLSKRYMSKNEKKLK